MIYNILLFSLMALTPSLYSSDFQMNLNAQLRAAAETGRSAEVTRLIAAGAEVNAEDPHDKHTPLMLAALSDDIATVEAILINIAVDIEGIERALGAVQSRNDSRPEPDRETEDYLRTQLHEMHVAAERLFGPGGGF